MRMNKIKLILIIAILALTAYTAAFSDILISQRGFLPIDFSGCVLWIYSDAGILKDESNRVQIFGDQSGNGYDFSELTDDYKPIYVSNQINGYPAIRFDGINDKMIEVSGNLAIAMNGPNNPLTVFMVVKLAPASASPNYLLLFDKHVDIDCDRMRIVYRKLSDISRKPQLGYQSYFSGVLIDNEFLGNNNSILNTWTLQEIWGAAGSSISWIQNGVSIGIDSGDTSTSPQGTYTTTTLGAFRTFDNVYSLFIEMDLAELIIYNVTLSSLNRTTVRNYLNAKYAIY